MSKSGHWFHSKSPAAKRAYLRKHPDSVYAKRSSPVKRVSSSLYTSTETQHMRERHARVAALKQELHNQARKNSYGLQRLA